MLHAVIIDDELNGVKSLELLIKKYIPEVKVVAITTKPVEGVELINNFRPDIVFLDISMPVLNGFEVLEQISFKNFELVFTTAHREYGLKALKINAKDYLLKPIDLDDLKACIARIGLKRSESLEMMVIKNQLAELLNSQNQRVPLNHKNGIDFVHAQQILCIEANSNHSKVTFNNLESIEVTKPLKDYENLLCKNNVHFMRINNSCIINLKYVTKYKKEDGGYALLGGKKTVPISKTRLNDFLIHINYKD